MKRAIRAMLCGATAILLVAGCSHLPGGISDSTTPIDGREYDELGLVNTTDSRVLLFGFIPISGSNSIRAAMEKAIRAKGADALIEVTVESYNQFWILFTRDVIKVEGRAIRFKRRR